jgi:hypothetical protein
MFATEIPLLSTTKYPIEKKINIKIKITKASKKKNHRVFCRGKNLRQVRLREFFALDQSKFCSAAVLIKIIEQTNRDELAMAVNVCQMDLQPPQSGFPEWLFLIEYQQAATHVIP